MMSSTVYVKSSLITQNGTNCSFFFLCGYSSKVGYIRPIFPEKFSIRDLISSAVPFPTHTCSGLNSKYFAARRLFTAMPEGYSLISVSKLAFISSINL